MFIDSTGLLTLQPFTLAHILFCVNIIQYPFTCSCSANELLFPPVLSLMEFVYAYICMLRDRGQMFWF